MPRSDPSRKRCAIYTRKSSEEGLEQEFNSLQAQCEACEAYIRSQRHEGWGSARTRYDDGGFSGGNMERPALQRLLADIQGGRIDIIVVYKVDRLTRSLADFARLVEIFDAQGVSFVSVTQQFNTTSSMGRLTLNVLLSFAQFEREVTGERIRDKIAASKKKGMWMGGIVPLGYDASERTLVINPAEAETVQRIFAIYRELGCVRGVKEEADRLGLSTKRSTTAGGIECGGKPFSRGHIYNLLSNPIYIGEIAHKGQLYPGQHPALIDAYTWAAVRDQLAANARDHRRKAHATEPSLLAGLLTDAQGERLTPSHAVKKGRRYRYYVSTEAGTDRPQGWRLAAQEIEDAVIKVLADALTRPAMLLARFDTAGVPGDQTRKMLDRATRFAAVLNRSPAERAKVVPRPHREGCDRGECNHNQGSAQPVVGRGSHATLIGKPRRQPNRAYNVRGLQAPRCRNEAGATGSGITERQIEMRPHADQGDRPRARVVRRACRRTRAIAAGIGRARRHHPSLCPAPRRPRLSEPRAGRGDPARPATRRTHRDASYPT
jgi:DNA invertase Pin-like site-specific DNA recombinase